MATSIITGVLLAEKSPNTPKFWQTILLQVYYWRTIPQTQTNFGNMFNYRFVVGGEVLQHTRILTNYFITSVLLAGKTPNTHTTWQLLCHSEVCCWRARLLNTSKFWQTVLLQGCYWWANPQHTKFGNLYHYKCVVGGQAPQHTQKLTSIKI